MQNADITLDNIRLSEEYRLQNCNSFVDVAKVLTGTRNMVAWSSLGHGVAAKLSQRLGEGILNGLLTARLGLAAIEVTRPLPFTALPRPALADLAKDLLRKREDDE